MSDQNQPQELQLHPTDQRVKEVRALVGGMLTTVERALPGTSKGDPDRAERFLQICMTAILADLSDVYTRGRKDSRVQNIDYFVQDKALVFASDESLKRVMAQAAEVNLQPGSALGYFWFIRRGDIATSMIGVNGYTQLLLRHPDVAKVHANVIFEADKFEVIFGECPRLIHEPAWTLEPRKPVAQGGRGNCIGAYAVLTRKNGFIDFDVMSRWELDRAQAEAKGYGSVAYRDWPEEMDKRTVLKRAQKRWPKSSEFENALALDVPEDDDQSTAAPIETTATTAPGQPAAAAPPVSKQKAALDDLARSLPMPRPNTAQSYSNGAAESASVGK